eukprot:GFUD01124795.1.p1 GENE.GFUD01124795.1~~GFUD01124795.1.p1  ORF type:complete len:213 (+),score=79.79 GFUD01124795.1:44-682(+)
MEPEHLREEVTIPNMNASFLYPEEHCLKSPTPAPPPFLDMMETIIEFEEVDDESPARCSTSTPGHNQSHHFHLSSPMENSSLQFQSPVPTPNNPVPFLSPMDHSHPLPPVNTPTSGHGQAALLHRQHHLLVTQAAAKLAAVPGSTQQLTTAAAGDQGLQLLRDSLAGLGGDQQVQDTEELLRTAAAFIRFCRRREGEELARQFRMQHRKDLM